MFFCLFLFSQLSLSFCGKRPKLIKEGEAENYTPQERFNNPSTEINEMWKEFANIDTSNENGGAILINKNPEVNVTLQNCKFTSCKAKTGGAIYISYQGGGDALICTVSNTEFSNCEATMNGGVAYLNTDVKKLHSFTFNGCTFNQNTANQNGGAIYSIGRDQLTISKCTFTNNKITSKSYNGSSIYCQIGWHDQNDQNDTFILADCVFTFTPDENNLCNVFIQNKKINSESTEPNANVFIGGCTFESTNEEATGFKHLEIYKVTQGFESINFISCNCVRQGSETVSIQSKFTLSNFNFDCKSDTCTPGPEIPGIPDKDPSNPDEKPDETPDEEGYKPSERLEFNTASEAVNVFKTKFTNLQSTNNGGAIYTEKSNITINDCKFTSVQGKTGGAIYVFLSKVNSKEVHLYCKITNCHFTSCSATANGGAIYLEATRAEVNPITIEDCTFTSNEASQNGGAVYGKQVRDELIMQRCVFTNNKAAEGSSVWIAVGNANGNDSNDTAVFVSCTFIANDESSSNVYITNTKIADTTATKAHVGIYFDGCSFSAENPSNKEYKNLILYEEQGGYKTISFLNCNCFKQPISSITYPTSLGLTNVQFECQSLDKCTPTEYEPSEAPDVPEETPDADGYTNHDRINDEGVAVTLKKNKFTNLGSDSEDGGAILIYQSGKRVSCTLEDCKFDSCRAKNGGAMRVYFASTKGMVFHLTNCLFNNCQAVTNGGAIYFQSARVIDYDVSISTCTFTSNKAGGNGGGAYLIVADNFTMQHCVFDNNVAVSGSSLWFQEGCSQNETDANAAFIDNTFKFEPTANSINVYITNYKKDVSKDLLQSILSFGQSKFVANGNTVNVEFKHLVIAKNGDGFKSITLPDCICIQQGKETVTLPDEVSDKHFSYNCNSYDSCGPSDDGYINHGRVEDEIRTGPINLENYKFVKLRNEDNYGGAITIYKQRTSCTIKNCKFDSCYAVFGGAIYIQYAGTNETYTCTISDTIFVNNQVKTNGGAFYCEISQSKRHTITLTNCTFKSNVAGKNGGAVYAMTRDGFAMNHCTFEDNSANGIGCSVWCRVGINNEYNHNEVSMYDNSFTFTPTKKEAINVHIESRALTGDTTANANLNFGKNFFNTEVTEITDYKHLEVVAPSAFETLNFDQCNCVKQGSETVSLPYSFDAELYFNFNCQSIDSCQTKQPTPPPTADTDGYISSDRIELSVAPILSLTKTKFIGIESEKEGGAISLDRVSCSLTDCKFESCKTNTQTKNGGGAVYVSYSGTTANYSCSIVNCLFSKCESTLSGGALYIYISQAKRHSANIQGCTFTQNKAINFGGGVYSICRDLLTIQNCIFNNNIAKTGSSLWVQVGWNEGNKDNDNRFVSYGNTFVFQATEETPVNVYIKSNSLKENINPNANLFLGHCNFVASNINGEIQKHLVIDESGEFQSIVFTDCNCIQGGEETVLINVSSKPNLENAFKFYCNNINQCPSSDSEQPPPSDECSSYQKRQEIYGKEHEIKKSCFYNLRSQREGGAIHASNAEIELEECRFKNCKSEGDGGAVYISFTIRDCELDIKKCIFEDCSSIKQGGGVFFENKFASESSIKECDFIRNNASSHGGALYYAPCANSKLLKCFFVNNTCTQTSNSYGSSVYVIVQNINLKKFIKKSKLTKDDDDDDDDIEDRNVFIDGNRIRSEPVENDRQVYINLKKTGKLQLGENSFSFNGAMETPSNTKYIEVSADEGADFSVTGEICVDAAESTDLIAGIGSNIKSDCHKADSEFDAESREPPKSKGKSNVGLIVGVVVAVVVVIVIIVVVVVVVVKRKNRNQYISDIADDDNNSGAITNDDAEFAT